MQLRHLRIPGPISYSKVAGLQEALVRRILQAKASDDCTYRYAPLLITTEFKPVYTCGRREIGNVSTSQQDHLRAGGRAHFHEAKRGGQTTFHGPGQLVAYPLLDLAQHALRPKIYVDLLQDAVIQTCRHFGIAAMTTDNPGVWVTPDTKIAALGIHLRRNVSSHGIGLNVTTDLTWFHRIVACGLPDKTTTSMAQQGLTRCTLEQVEAVFVRKLALALPHVDSVESVAPHQLGLDV